MAWNSYYNLIKASIEVGIAVMMGSKVFQGKLFYRFSLEDKVPGDHILRIIKNAVDFSFIRKIARPFYSHTGAPSIDPEVILKMSSG